LPGLVDIDSMLNFETRREAVERLRVAVASYNDLAQEVMDEAQRLHDLRRATSDELIVAVEQYINALANSPKEFEKSVSEYNVAIHSFNSIVSSLEAEIVAATIHGGVGAGASIGIGAATMATAPAAAMGIATTFGTASTGTAISALSGAAQASAATAWLGGGALSAGGGGVAVGARVIAVLGGPVGWGVGAVALVATAVWTNHRNAEIAERAMDDASSVTARIHALRTAKSEVSKLASLTSEHASGARDQLQWLQTNAPGNYRRFSEDAKMRLGALVNNIQSMTKLLNTQVA